MQQAENPACSKYKTAPNWDLERPLPAVIGLGAISQAMLLESAVRYLGFFVEPTISLYQTLLLCYLTNAIFGWLYKCHI